VGKRVKVKSWNCKEKYEGVDETMLVERVESVNVKFDLHSFIVGIVERTISSDECEIKNYLRPHDSLSLSVYAQSIGIYCTHWI